MARKLKSLDEVIGHSGVVKWFKGCIERDHLPQVIMLTGPTGIGKTTMAKIVACEIAYMNAPDKLQEAKKAVIEDDKSTDAVRLYNMSNLKSQEAVHEVKSDLNIGFSSTGRKVIIMDEAHGMSDEAQDSLLTAFESLQSQVYIIVCSTELSSFRDAFVGRCLLRRLVNLSSIEMRQLLRQRVEDNKLKFELPLNMVYGLISIYTGREPRRAINLLDSFQSGSTITKEEFESFINIYEGKQLLTLIDYLYAGDILSGLNFIADLEMGTTMVSTLLELLKVAQGGQSSIIDRDGTQRLWQLAAQKGTEPLVGLCIDASTCSRLTRNRFSGFFLKWCNKTNITYKSMPEKASMEQVNINDMIQMGTMLEEKPLLTTGNTEMQAMSLEALFAESEAVE